MRIIREDTIYQLTFFNSDSLSVNCYFVEESDSLTLIDTAIPKYGDEILKCAMDIGKPITKIVLTHAHHDHIGSLDELKLALPDAQVFLSNRESRILRGDRKLDRDEPNLPIRGMFPRNVQTHPDVLLNDGDRVGSLLTLYVPGHTPGSIALLDMRNHALIAGDALQTEGGIAVAGQLCPSFPFPSLGTWSPRKALESARNLIMYNPTLLAVGHGRMLKEPLDEMSTAIAEAAQNLELEENKKDKHD